MARTARFALLAVVAMSGAAAWADEPPPPAGPPPAAPPAAPEAAAPAAAEPPAVPAPQAATSVPPPAEVPPAPPMPPAYEVVPKDCCGTLCAAPPPSPCWKVVELQGHLSMLTPGPEGPVSLDFGASDQIVWDPIDYGIGGGGRAEILWPISNWIVNVGGTFWGNWQDTALTTGRLAAGSPVSPSPPFTDVGLTAEATLWGVDLAFLKTHCVSPCLFTGWGVGLRAMTFDEEGDLAVPGINPAGPPVGSVSMEAENCLLAAQLVGQVQWKLAARWDLRVRAAAFVGWLNKETEVTTASFGGIGTQVPQHDEEDTVGYGGELEVSVGWCVRRGWTLRAGYGLLMLGNVSRLDEASDWSNTIPTGVISASQGEDVLFAHRLFLGVTIDL